MGCFFVVCIFFSSRDIKRLDLVFDFSGCSSVFVFLFSFLSLHHHSGLIGKRTDGLQKKLGFVCFFHLGFKGQRGKKREKRFFIYIIVIIM